MVSSVLLSEEVKKVFYDQLTRACERKGRTPSAVALAAGMSKANVTNWKSGASPTLATVTRLAKELEVPVIELLDDSTSEVPKNGQQEEEV